MNLEVIDKSRQLVLNGIPIEALIGSLAFLVAILSLFIAVKSARETARANTLSFLPVVTLDFDDKTDKIIVRNIGKSSAVNIVLDKYYNWSADANFDIFGKSTVVFERINILDAGNSITVDHEVKGLPDVLGLLTFTIFSKHSKNINFIVKFNDISGKRYYTVVQITRGKVEIRLFPRQFGFMTAAILVRHKLTQYVLSLIYSVIVKFKKYKHESNKKKKR